MGASLRVVSLPSRREEGSCQDGRCRLHINGRGAVSASAPRCCCCYFYWLQLLISRVFMEGKRRGWLSEERGNVSDWATAARNLVAAAPSRLSLACAIWPRRFSRTLLSFDHDQDHSNLQPTPLEHTPLHTTRGLRAPRSFRFCCTLLPLHVCCRCRTPSPTYILHVHPASAGLLAASLGPGRRRVVGAQPI